MRINRYLMGMAVTTGLMIGVIPRITLAGIIQFEWNDMFAVLDGAANLYEYARGDGIGIGGSPTSDGSFAGFNFNFDITGLTVADIGISDVPLPATC